MNDNPTTIGEITKQVTKKVQVSNLNLETYISTDNMLPNLGGIEKASGMPTIEKAKEFKAGDVLFSNIRTYFKKVWYARFDGGCSNDVLVFRGGKNVNSRFLYYIIADKNFIEYTVKTAKGTKMPRGDKDAIIKYGLNLPSFSEQKAIAYILGKLDDKIALNRQMNQTLEAMVQALFKSWFVDFDPVLDNALESGSEIPDSLQAMAEKRQLVPNSKKLLHTNPALAAQFPSAFVFNEVLDKWVPKGWGDINLAKLIRIKHGYAFKGEFFSDEPTNDILLTPGNFKIGGGIKLEKLKYYNGEIPKDYILKKDDLIITMTDLSKEGDTLGFPALIPQNDKLKFLHNQRLGKVEYLSNGIGSKFLYHCLCDREYRFVIVGSASGTTVKHTSPSKILLHNILFSGGELEALFEKIVNPNFNKIEMNNQESEILTQLRDRLLPELISGRVRVPTEIKNNF
jgi:type I restriction enzyme S subunit